VSPRRLRAAAPDEADGHLWPDAEQRLLLDAALADGATARDAYREWRARTDVDAEFGPAVVRLMPLVYRNLTRLGVDDALLGRLKGVYRRAWYETHQVMERSRPAVEALVARGMDVLLLKGAPLVLAYYRNHALRPMSDLDLCVRPDRATEAVAALTSLGWRPTAEPDSDRFRFCHALQFVHPAGGELDLHWHVMYEACRPGLDDALWADAESLDFGGLAVRQLGPTTLLLHTVLHGVRWNDETPIRWIPDALTILRARGDAVDWTRLVETGRRLAVTHRLGLGLDYLAREFDAAVPGRVLHALRTTTPSLVERLERTVILRDTSDVKSRATGNQWSIVVDLARLVDPVAHPLHFAASYPHYLRFRAGLGGRRDILPMVARGVARRLGARHARTAHA